MTKKMLFGFNNLNFDALNASPETTKVPLPEGNEYIVAYKNDPIQELVPIKGFYLNSTIIDAIKNTPDVESLFLYLAKRTVTPVGYTIVSILASKNANGEDVLMTDKIYEWHDSINIHTPTNEGLIGY